MLHVQKPDPRFARSWAQCVATARVVGFRRVFDVRDSIDQLSAWYRDAVSTVMLTLSGS